MIVENNPKYSRDTHYLPFDSYYAGEDYYKDGNTIIRVRKYVDVYCLGYYDEDLYYDILDYNSPNFKKVKYKCYEVYNTVEDEWKYFEESFSKRWKKLTEKQLARAINLEKKKIELIKELKK